LKQERATGGVCRATDGGKAQVVAPTFTVGETRLPRSSVTRTEAHDAMADLYLDLAGSGEPAPAAALARARAAEVRQPG
jgi:hypothetical protein